MVFGGRSCQKVLWKGFLVKMAQQLFWKVFLAGGAVKKHFQNSFWLEALSKNVLERVFGEGVIKNGSGKGSCQEVLSKTVS